MIVDQTGGRRISIRRRDPHTLERIEEHIEAYPYLFIKKDDDIDGVVRYGEDAKCVYGDDLKKAFFRTDYERNLQRRRGSAPPTWEGGVSFTNQVLTDRIVAGKDPNPNYEHKIWYIDGEWKSESEEITVLSAYCSHTERMYTWVQHPDLEPGYHGSLPCKNHPEGLTEVTFDTKIKAFANERDLLIDFAKHMKKHDPDILTGWYFVDADVSTISHAMKRNGVDPRMMSPFKQHNYKYSCTEKNWTQPIPGRICLDLMLAFSKLWTLKNGQLAGKKLDDVADLCLGERKVELPDGHDTYYTDIGTYVDYNRQDVRLLPRLDKLINVTGYHTALQHLVQCDFQTTPLTTAPATSLFLQDNEFGRRVPDDPMFDKVDYQGADIQEPVPGRYSNIAIMDIKAMYHSNVNLHNICWTTLGKNGQDCGNGISFTQDKQGILGRTMDKLTVKRNEYKQLMKSDPNNYKKWDAMQFATKSMIASLYGVSGDSKYGMYHPDIAAAITYTSRQTLFRLRDECNERGYPVRYGHTDSIFCEVPTPEEGLQLVAKINEAMAPIETEFEKWCETMVLKRKNRYAGKVTWTEGSFHDPQYYYKGLELIQARMPKAMKQAMDSTLRGILDGKEQDSITDEICDLVKQGISGDLGDDLLMTGKLRRKLSSYKVLSGASAGALWARNNLGITYDVGDAFLIAVNEEGQTMAFNTIADLPRYHKIDWHTQTEKFIVNKACDIYDLVEWDTQPLWNALRGIGQVDWL